MMVEFLPLDALASKLGLLHSPGHRGTRQLARLLILLCALGDVACEAPAEAVHNGSLLRLTTGLPGAFFNPLGTALITSLSAAIPDVRFEVVPRGGALENSPGGATRAGRSPRRAAARTLGLHRCAVDAFRSLAFVRRIDRDSHHPQFIKTAQGGGYRLTVSVGRPT